ncbi:DUF4131 domain-containing protein [Sphingobacteriales bacterium UPWRP_1]|nr:hypothetical protein BVG80_03945 [Sphingobacteriales bacterium TSM_CSM]PSJ75721.1 DUF4131 domain-containing protein [Sphingobacteriales bacterium UPWRP_1]
MQQIINWEELPALRLLLPFTGGILLAIYTPVNWWHLPFFALSLWVCLLLLGNWRLWEKSYGWQWLFGALLSVLLLVCGFSITQQHRQLERPGHFSRFLSDSSFVLMRLNEPLIEKDRSYKAEAAILEVHNGTSTQNTEGKALLYFAKDSLAGRLKYGDVLLAKARFTNIAPPKNPGEFNYKQYLAYQQIYQQGYIKQGMYHQLPVNTGNRLFSFVYVLRTYFINAINRYIPGADEKAVAAALLLGYTQFLQDDMQQTYSHTGTIHVLAVSGLHVGIIYLAAGSLLFFLDRRGRWGIWVKMVLLIGIVWLYALLSGLPPSVSRSAAMFTFFSLAQLFNRRTNSYNIIATSALLLLCIDPFLITRIGFQLSYAAVAGIIFYQPRFYEQFSVQNKYLDKIWQLSSVTLAAQLATTPLTLYYFNQFPSYFLLANLVAVPLSGIVLQLGFVFFLISPFTPIAKLLGLLLSWGIKALNTYLYYVQQLPFSVVQGLSVSHTEMLLLYVFIALATFFFLYRQVKYMKWSLLALLLLTSGWAVAKYRHLQYREICIYQLKNATAIELVKGYNAVVIADSAGMEQFTDAPATVAGRPPINKRQYLPLEPENLPQTAPTPTLFAQNLFLQLPFLQFFNHKMLLLADSADYCPQPTAQKIALHLGILTQNCNAPLEQLQHCFTFDTLIIDGSNKGWLARKWTAEADSLRIPVYNTYEKGAFVRNW